MFKFWCGTCLGRDESEMVDVLPMSLAPDMNRFGVCKAMSPRVEEGPEPVVKEVFDRQESPYEHGVRTTADSFTTAARALEKLQLGNKRFVEGKIGERAVGASVREALATHGQNPMAAVVGCADSRCPAELIFDVRPGDLFVLRNAGNTLTCAEASFIGSAEYCCGPLGTNLVLVLGHTKCGAIAGATKAFVASQGKGRRGSKTTLEKLLGDLQPVAQKAQEELGENASEAEIAAHAIQVNVFHTIDMLLTHSKPLRDKVNKGDLEVQGAIFDITTGKVNFLGKSPRTPEILSSMKD